MAASLCAFCGEGGVDADLVGDLLVREEIAAHQYCLYFSSGLAQCGDENEQVDAINGFRFKDIRKELQRGLSVKCVGCHKPGGYIGCAMKSCRKAGHFPCLQRLGFLFHYAGNFEAYCPRHSPTQPKLQSEATMCCVCLTTLSNSQLYCPCCLTIFHKACIQKQALSAGLHHLCCPVCKDKETYCSEMLRMGIAIPDRDAQWEIGTSYSYEESKFCHAEVCLCPQGRFYHTQIGKYRIRKCRTCGQSRGHVDCLRDTGSSECRDCSSTGSLPIQPQPFPSTPRPLGRKVPVIKLKKLNSKDISLINQKLSS